MVRGRENGCAIPLLAANAHRDDEEVENMLKVAANVSG